MEYVGQYKDGEKHGKGTYYWYDGNKYVGEFKDGRVLNGDVYDKNGNIKSKWVNGKHMIIK